MADIVSNKFLETAIDDFLAARKVAGTLKLILIMSQSELETDQAAVRDDSFVGDFADLDEADGSGFTWGHGNDGRKTVTLTGEVDDTNDRGSMESVTGTYTWASLGADCSRSITGVLMADEGTSDDSDALWVAYYQFAAPRPADGADFPVNFDAGSGKFIKFNQGS